jgi:putative transcription antitermination factor YqgF
MFTHIAIDWGSVSIGLAVGDSSSGLIIALKDQYTPKNIWEVLNIELHNRPQISTIIVGIPTSFHGKETIVSKHVRDFCDTLKEKFPQFTIVTINERSTTQRSVEKLAPKSPKHQIDNQAACEILENYFLLQN